jgi:2-dehydropantoate 2-reductase
MDYETVLMLGTGALATFFAARLSAIGIPVTMLGTWRGGLDALNSNGARLVDADGMTTAHRVRAIDDPADCKEVRLALVLVKAWQTERAATQLAQCLASDGLALTLQNGLGNYEVLTAVLGQPRVALGITTAGTTMLGPGLVRAGGEGIVSIENHPRLGVLPSLMRDAGFNVEVVADARTLVWSKLVINTAINPLTALLHIPNGQLLERPAARMLMNSLAREAATVAEALGIQLPFDDPVGAVEDVARRTAANHSSMFQDIRRGAPTEIEAICGAVVHAGEQSGVPTPVNWAMLHLVRASVTAK